MSGVGVRSSIEPDERGPDSGVFRERPLTSPAPSMGVKAISTRGGREPGS
jgi:hypothetical protein